MEYRFSKSLDAFQSSAVREILKLTQGKSVVSFAGGLPAEEFFPLEAVRAAFDRVFDQGKSCLQYGLTEGYAPLREAIAERLKQKSIFVTQDDLLLTTGSQQAIDLLTRIYLDPGETVLVQQPTYLAALQVLQARGVRIVSVESDADGMLPEDVERKIREHAPKLVYVSPTFSNPTGYVWTEARRRSLLETCRRHGVLILEDDPYGELQYGSNDRFPSIFSMDEHPKGSCVVYTSTFSKTVAPALRTGWVTGDPSLIQAMVRAKQAADLHSSSMDQQALYQLTLRFDLDAHIALIRREYEARMKRMDALLAEMAADDLSWNQPKGGMFLWAEARGEADAELLLPSAVGKGVAFVPGKVFYSDAPKRNAMRLNFTHADPQQMRLGVERLVASLREYPALH